MTYSANINLNEVTSPYIGVINNLFINGSYGNTYQKTNTSNMINFISNYNMSYKDFISNGPETQSNMQSNSNTTVDINMGLNQTGGLDLDFLPKNLTKPGDSIIILNNTITLTGSQVIDVMGKKIDCWVAQATYNANGIPINSTVYYDKTTRFNLKVLFNNQNVTVPNTQLT